MPSVTKWNIVQPSIFIWSRASWVSTITVAWYGSSSPHQPFQLASSQSPRTGPEHVAAHDSGADALDPGGHDALVRLGAARGHRTSGSLLAVLVGCFAAAHRSGSSSDCVGAGGVVAIVERRLAMSVASGALRMPYATTSANSRAAQLSRRR